MIDRIATHPSAFLFEGFRLERHGELRHADGTPVPLGSRALDILRVLVEHGGQLVPKQQIMEAVWPGLAVEDGNLTVQISAIRKALDAGRPGPSCIQTVPGRGYRFTWPVTPTEAASRIDTPASAPPVDHDAASTGTHTRTPARGASFLRRWLARAAIVAVLGSAALYAASSRQYGPTNSPPRLSLVVLPFQSIDADLADTYLADAITDDLTSDLSHIQGAKVIARSSARSYKDRVVDARLIGRELEVRYVLHGTVRRVENALRVNAELVAAETGAQIWSDRFDEDIRDLNAGQQHIVIRIKGALGINLLDYESARSARERPTDPDAFDLVLRARAIWPNQMYNHLRGIAAQSLYERALQLDPSSVPAALGLATLLVEQVLSGHADADGPARAETLIAQASAVEPNTESVMEANLFVLRAKERWGDVVYTAQKLIERYPNNVFGYHQLANAKLFSGNAEEAIAPLEIALRLEPRGPAVPLRYQKMTWALLLLGRFPEAIVWAERYLSDFPDSEPPDRAFAHLAIAAGQAWSGHKAEAERAVAEANRVWPFATVRSQGSWGRSSPSLHAQFRRYQEALRLAGLRDHVDEAENSGVAPATALRTILYGRTPMTVQGAITVTTPVLAALLAEQKPIVIDTLTNAWAKSLPGAIALPRAGRGGTFSDQTQDRLRRKLQQLTGGDVTRPIVAAGWNAERFDGHNLTLRLIDLGYRNVFWYRGGREAWEAAGMPEGDLALLDW